jgi:hypothetical protein
VANFSARGPLTMAVWDRTWLPWVNGIYTRSARQLAVGRWHILLLVDCVRCSGFTQRFQEVHQGRETAPSVLRNALLLSANPRLVNFRWREPGDQGFGASMWPGRWGA